MTGYKHENEDEIKLIDILSILWKWKYLIIAGSVVFGCVAWMISYTAWKNTPQSFRTTMVLKPGVLSMDIKGNEQYIDSLENMKSLVEGEFKYKISSNSEGKDELTSIIPVDLYATIQNNLNIEVSCISNPPEVGVKMLDLLLRLITDKYIEKEKFIRNKLIEKEKSIQNELIEKEKSIQNELIEKEKSIQNELWVAKKSKIEEKKDIVLNNITLELQLTIISNRLIELRSRLREIEIQSRQLLQHEKVLAQQNNANLSLFYLNIIQKNMDFENQFRQNIYSCSIEKENIQFQLKKNEQAVIKLQQEIDELESSKKSKQTFSAVNKSQSVIEQSKNETSKKDLSIVHVIQAPISQPIEKENKIKLTVSLSLITGLFFWFFLSLFIEYIRKYRRCN